jgi:DNA polymerase-3 subunit alpha
VPEDRHPDYKSRLDYEVAMINRMGFSGYFLIVSDFIRWAKDRGIPVGPGRGSGAGSLVAWALSITDLDPIRFNLLFERFLNPERVSMPDFDIDFCQDRRDEVIIYVREKYGADRVAHIITFGKLQARAVLRDVGRVLHIPYPVVDKVCKLVPNNPNQPVTLPEAIAADSQLQAMIGQDEAMQKLVEIATRLEGLYRHASTHAAGVVIADRPLTELVPLYQDPRAALPATQFSMKDVERAGLLKFDFLGLKTLTVLALAARMVKENRGTDIDLSRIPLDDPATFALLQRVETTGVFQLESKGMRDVVARLQPDRFEEIVALVALYRPGPMDDIPRYLACKQGLEPVQYMHPALEPILEETFGVMVYQEQVMQIAQVLGGYSLGQADLLRRAMGKKIRSEMEAQEKQFVQGAVERGVEHDVAARIFQQMSKFAGYGFNKSHSAPYALVAYQTAWMKANFLPEFMGALMTLDMHNTDKLGGYVQELAHLGLPLLPPDINHSGAAFAVEVQPDGRKALRYGLAAVRNVGRSLAEALVEARKQAGPYRSLPDMMGRLDPSLVNRRQIEHLVFAGALDSVHPCRRALHEGLEGWMKEAARAREQAGLFDAAPVPESAAVAEKADWPTLERLEYERQAIGFYLSSHPFERYKVFLGRCGVQTVLDMTAGSEESGAGEPDQDHSVWSFRLAGILTQVQKRRTKKGQVFAFVQLSDPAGMVDIAVFPELYQTCLGSLVVGQHVVIEGQGRAEGEQSRLVASQITLFDSFLSEQLRVLDLQVKDPRVLPGLADLLDSAPQGPGRVRLVPVDEAAKPVILSGYRLVFQIPSRILFSSRLLDQIDSLPGCHVPWHMLGV